MKLLWVKAGGLLPPDMGGKIRSYHILKQLARRHQITLFSFYPQHPDDQHLRGNGFFAKIVPVPLPLPPHRSLAEYLRAARLMAAGRPVTIEKFLSPEVRRRYAELIASSAFDVIVCDFLVPGALMHWHTPPPTILFTHNVEAQVWQRHYKVASNPFVKTAAWLEARALATAERRYVQAADHVLAVSENDRAFFSNMSNPTAYPSFPPAWIRNTFSHPRSLNNRTPWYSPAPWTGCRTKTASPTSPGRSFRSSIARFRRPCSASWAAVPAASPHWHPQTWS